MRHGTPHRWDGPSLSLHPTPDRAFSPPRPTVWRSLRPTGARDSREVFPPNEHGRLPEALAVRFRDPQCSQFHHCTPAPLENVLQWLHPSPSATARLLKEEGRSDGAFSICETLSLSIERVCVSLQAHRPPASCGYRLDNNVGSSPSRVNLGMLLTKTRKERIRRCYLISRHRRTPTRLDQRQRAKEQRLTAKNRC